ncbi:MAG: LamG-like jellyroll fold domain-containing protein, partial [Candidatus Latescibacterota bacterium]
PLAEFQVYHVNPGFEPAGVHAMTYALTSRQPHRENRSIAGLLSWIRNRYPEDERQVMLALPERAPRSEEKYEAPNPLPLVHVIIPCEFRDEGARTAENAYGGFNYELVNLPFALDGIAIDIPALTVKPTHGEYYPLNIQVKDPIWPNRNMLDFSFSVKPGEAKTLWLDTRDRILPERKSLYLTVSGAGGDFGPGALEGAQLRLIFKEREKAIPEHEIDRFTQARDNLAGNLSETRPQRTKLEWYARQRADLEDLLRVSPNHEQGRQYWNWYSPETGSIPFEQPKAPTGIPLWAFRQTEIVKQWKYFLNWWIDNRQIENGEFGGGLSDDGDFANCMPGMALMGVDAAKITDSLHRLMEAYYNNGMFTNGLCTIVTDALHVSEEGTNVQTELMLLEYGDPKLVERIMETAARYPEITGVNQAGHRHFTSRFYSSTFQATEEPWSWSSSMNYSVLHPGMTLVEFNGHPAALRLIGEVGDGYLAHAVKDANGRLSIPREINYLTDEGREISGGAFSELFRVLHRWTGDPKYASWGRDSAPGARPAVDKDRLAESYASAIQYNAQRMYIATEGFPWDDSPYLTYGSVLVDRLGGPVLNRGNQTLQQAVSWKFDKPYGAENTALLIPRPTPVSLKIVAYNLLKDPQSAAMNGWDVEPGTWEVTEGVDANGDDLPDTAVTRRTVAFERTGEVRFTFPPRKNYVIQMELKEKGTPYRSRPELGIGKDDVLVKGGKVEVTVHNLGSVDSPSATIALLDASGSILARAETAALKAPLDYKPKTGKAALAVPKKISLEGCRIVIDPEGKMREITRFNNEVLLKGN